MSEHTVGHSDHTIEEISAYLDRGRRPRIAAIDSDPDCQALMASMEHLGNVARTLTDEDITTSAAPTEAWYEQLLGTIRNEVRAGKDLAIDDLDSATRTTVTEGALRELARRAGDEIAGVLVGSVKLTLRDDLDPSTLDVRVEVGALFGVDLRERGDLVRHAVHASLAPHTPVPLGDVDVAIVDLFTPQREEPE